MSLIKYYEPNLGFPRSVNWMLDRFFDDTLGRVSDLNTFTPHVDVLEDKDKYVLKVTVPGMKKDDFKVEVHNGQLTISGERKLDNKQESEKNGVKYHLVESSYGMFNRRFRLPDDVKAEALKATYADGILELALPKRPEAKPQTVSIEVK